MRRNDMIGIVGTITQPPFLIIDAPDWKRKVYETMLTRKRPNGQEDTYILQFPGVAAGSKEELEKMKDGADVWIGGEIRTKNRTDPKPEENRVKIYIYAEIIRTNDPAVKDQNEVRIVGCVCKEPYKKKARQKEARLLPVTNIMVAVNTPSAQYIPVACWGKDAVTAAGLAIGDKVTVYGRFMSRHYTKRIEGHDLPYMCTTYEVAAKRITLGEENEEGKEKEK